MKKNTVFLLLMVAVITLTSCQVVSAQNDLQTETATSVRVVPTLPDSAGAEITVAAAADLQFAFTDLANLFEERTGTKVVLVFGSSGQTTQQIENGAPYDLFAAANIDYINRLLKAKLIREESVALYARGRVVLASNRQSGLSLSSLQDLLNPEIKHIAIANPDHAPYGVAAQQALEASGLWEAVQPKLVYAENVRQALQYIQTGDAEAGIIALSVADVPEINWTLIDESLHKPLDQALAILTSSPHPEIASQFAKFINGESGRPIMRRYGFVLPGETPLITTGTRP